MSLFEVVYATTFMCIFMYKLLLYVSVLLCGLSVLLLFLIINQILSTLCFVCTRNE